MAGGGQFMLLRTYKTKADFAVLVIAVFLLLVNLAAIGASGHRRAREIVCQANLGKWGRMFDAHTRDHDGKFNAGWGVGEKTLWMNALRPYYGDEMRLLLCPSATRTVTSARDLGTFTAWKRHTSLPGGGDYPYVGSYSINSWTNHMTTDRGRRLQEWFWGTTENVQKACATPVFGDSTWMDAWPTDTDQPTQDANGDLVGNQGTIGEMNHFCIDRHNGGINMLFMDWSVRRVGLKGLWTLKWHREFNIAGPWTQAGGALPENWPDWMQGFKDY
jgi:prepilin-type processing-associated H-X9-DG protein